MPLRTTVIGAYPKPDFLAVPDWFQTLDYSQLLKDYGKFQQERMLTEEYQKLYLRVLQEALAEQSELGVDVVTDGELDRECYVWFLCRHLQGFSFDNLEMGIFRGNNSTLPQVIGPVDVGKASDVLIKNWTLAQANSANPVKATIPGPLTIIGTSQNKFYSDKKELSLALAHAINKIVKALIAAGCKHIQIDEPVFMREVGSALDFGIEHASRCIEGCGKEVTMTIHLCCGYPRYMDDIDYQKADPSGYFQLAPHLDKAGFDEVSIEDAHCRNDLSLLALFKRSKVILGLVAIASSRVETVEEIRARLKGALAFIPADRLVVAPDCGLGFLTRNILRQKLANMCKAAKSLP